MRSGTSLRARALIVASALLTSLLGVAMPAQALGSLTWTKLAPAAHPSGRWWQATAYDETNHELVLFGGFTNPNHSSDTFLQDTWTWNGTTWKLEAPTTKPSARDGASMSFDPVSGKVILFGGFDGANRLADTWSWDGSNWSLLTPAASPPKRGWAAMAIDASTPASRRVLLFGGYDGASFNDTWRWDGSNWSQLLPAHSPTDRSDHGMAFDSAHGKMIVFGGAHYVGSNYVSQYADTWSWDGADWTQVATTGPASRADLYTTYDPRIGRVVLFGGFDNNAASAATANFQDTWTWTGAAWSLLSPTTKPTKRDSGTMTYFPPSGTVVLFGGYDAVAWDANLDASENDTWVLSFGTTMSAPSLSTATSANASFVVSWGAPGSVSSYVVQYARRVRTSTGTWTTSAWTAWKTVAGTVHSAAFAGAQGGTYLFHARAVYAGGAVSAYSPAVMTVVPYDDRASSAVFSTGWTRATASGRFLGTYTYTTAASKTMTFKAEALVFTLIGDKCTTCGKLRVYVDNVLVATIDTYRSATAVRQALYTKAFSATKLHTLKIVTLGTAGRPKVMIDAVAVRR